MNENIADRIDTLLKNVEEQKNKTVASSRIVSIVYILIAVIVVIYTTILFMKIKEGVNKENISGYVKAMALEQLDQVPSMLDELVLNQAEPMADHLIATIYDQVPTVENLAKGLINDYSGAMIAHVKKELFPQFHEIIRQNTEEIKVAAEALSDEEATKELAKIIVTKISEEIDYSHGLIFTEAHGEINKITKHLKEICEKPRKQLTNKEAAQRKLIVNWLYLVDREQGLDKILKTMLNRFGYSWEYMLQELGIKAAIDETMSAIPEETE